MMWRLFEKLGGAGECGEITELSVQIVTSTPGLFELQKYFIQDTIGYRGKVVNCCFPVGAISVILVNLPLNMI